MKSSPSAHGFSLVELITAVTVLGVIAAVLLPVLNGAADSYSQAAGLRESCERGAYAMDRCLQMLREAPSGTTVGTLDITNAQTGAVTFGAGHGIELNAGTLYLRDSSSATSPLCRNVTEFTISYIGSDGVSEVSSHPADTHRFVVKLTTAGVPLTAVAFPRVGVIRP